MIPSEDLRENWSILETLEPVAELRVREEENIEIAGGHVLFGLDAHRHRHMLIPVIPGTMITEDKRSSGVQIIAHPLLDHNTLQPFVDLVCLKPHLYELFSIVVSEVLELLEKDSSRPDRTCRQVLDRWRELLERDPSGQIGMEKLIGLFGELWYLREIVRHNPGAIRCWIGPRGSRHDLSAGLTAIEVKATLSRHGRFFEIHGHEQLEPPENGRLYLAALKLEQVSTSGESLQELVESIVLLGGDRRTLLTLLAQVNVSLADLDTCKHTRFRTVENRMYEVEAGFPRITSKSFATGSIPAGVMRLSYQIDLSSEPPWPLDESAVWKVYEAIASEVNAS